MSQNVVVKPHGSIAEIRLNRPEAYNAFDYDMIQNSSTPPQPAWLWTPRSVELVLSARERPFAPAGI